MTTTLTDTDILRVATGAETGGAAGDGPREHHFDDEALLDFARRLLERAAPAKGLGGEWYDSGKHFGLAIDAARIAESTIGALRGIIDDHRGKPGSDQEFLEIVDAMVRRLDGLACVISDLISEEVRPVPEYYERVFGAQTQAKEAG